VACHDAAVELRPGTIFLYGDADDAAATVIGLSSFRLRLAIFRQLLEKPNTPGLGGGDPWNFVLVRRTTGRQAAPAGFKNRTTKKPAPGLVRTGFLGLALKIYVAGRGLDLSP